MIFNYFLTGRRIFLHFEAVDSAFYAWVNGVPIGYRFVLHFYIFLFFFSFLIEYFIKIPILGYLIVLVVLLLNIIIICVVTLS